MLAAVAGAALLAAVLIGASVLTGRSDERAPVAAVDGSATAALFAGIPQDGTSLGRPDAPVTLVEFADFQCPYCAIFAREGLPEIVRRYVRTGKVRLEYRPLAMLGPDSLTTRDLALAAAEQGRFWQVAHLLYEHQGLENSGWATDEHLESIARAVPGLDVERALSEAESGVGGDEIQRTEAQAAQYEISGTPSFLAGRTGGPVARIRNTSLDAGALTPTLDRLLGG